MSRSFSHGPLDFRAMSPAIRFLMAANVIAFLLAWIVGLYLIIVGVSNLLS